MKNVYNAWTFLALSSLTLIVLGHFYGGRQGLLVALILGLGVNSFVYFYEDKRVLDFFKGVPLQGQDPYGLHNIAHRLALKARIATPKLIVMQSPAPQVLVVGRGITHGTILITDGLLQRFSRAELEAVMAYQIACIKNLNTLAFAVGSFIVSCSLFLTELLDRGLRFVLVEKKNPDAIITQFFTRLVAPLAGILLQICIRPYFYFAADEQATQLTGDPKTMAKVLWKLETVSKTIPFNAPTSTGHMFMVNPLTRLPWNRYFHAQPAARDRIERLVGYYPI